MNISQLLSYISKPYNELLLSKGELPTLVSKETKKYISGIKPISDDEMRNIEKKYLDSNSSIITNNINGREYLTYKEGNSIVFRFLKEVKNGNVENPALKAACSLSHGVIIVKGNQSEQRHNEIYKILSYINSIRNAKIHVIENQKYFTCKQSKSIFTFFFNPSLDLTKSLRIMNLSSYNILAICDYCKEAEEQIHNISIEKLVILGINENHKIDLNNILYTLDLESNKNEITYSTSIKPRINWNLLMENIKEGIKNA